MCTEKPLPIVSMELDNLPRTDGCLGECHCLPHTGEQCRDWGSGGTPVEVPVSLGNDPTVSDLHLSNTAATVPPDCCDVIWPLLELNIIMKYILHKSTYLVTVKSITTWSHCDAF